MNSSRAIFMGLAGLAAVGLTSPLLAHTKLVSSNPANGAVVTAAPRAITLRFNERVVLAFTTVELTMPGHGGMKVPVRVTVARDGKTVTGVPQARLSNGDYRIAWTAASADGHRMNGNVNFKVG